MNFACESACLVPVPKQLQNRSERWQQLAAALRRPKLPDLSADSSVDISGDFPWKRRWILLENLPKPCKIKDQHRFSPNFSKAFSHNSPCLWVHRFLCTGLAQHSLRSSRLFWDGRRQATLPILRAYRGSLNGGLANGGLRHLSTIVHDCLRLSSFCDENSPRKGAQKATKVHNCRRLCANCGVWP